MSRIDVLHDTMKPGVALAVARQMDGKVSCPVCVALATYDPQPMQAVCADGLVGLKCHSCGSNIVLTGHIRGITNTCEAEWAALGQVLGIEVPPIQGH